MTAGMIAQDFETLTHACAEGDATDLQSLASTFKSLVKDRNALLHGVPFTGSDGEQRLLHIGVSGRRDWTVEAIIDAGIRFEEAAVLANRLLHAGRYEAYSATGRSLSV